ncbi:MAG: hypothetical protein RIR70_1051 [Pseudomonadota bacterium]|jgi:small-conductance mechanosensitive channel
MIETDASRLLAAIEHGYPQPDLFWQLGLLALSLLIAAIFARAVRSRARKDGEDSLALDLGKGGLRRLAFALIAGVLVALAHFAMKSIGTMRVEILAVSLTLLLAWALIRTVVYALHVGFVSPSGWLSRFERWLAVIVWLGVALHLVGLLPGVIETLESVSFRVGKQNLTLWMMLQGAATVVVTVIVALWLGGLIESRLMATEGLDANLRLVFSRVTKTLLVTISVMIALPMVGIDLTTLSVFGGALGVGLGFGLQKIAANYVSGFIILLDRSIRIGNMISVGNDRGVVTQITTRYSVLQNLNGPEIIVPNEMLMGTVVLNETYSNPKIRLGVSLQVDYKTDVDQALRILEAAARAHPRTLSEPAPTAFLASFADSGINLEIGFWIADPQEGSLNIRSDISRDILRRFRAEGIEIPYPQREVRIVGGGGTGVAG